MLTSDKLADRLVTHLALRRDALDIIGRFGNRFEGWAKWELAVGLHKTSFTDAVSGVQAIAVERRHPSDPSQQNCDLVLWMIKQGDTIQRAAKPGRFRRRYPP